MSSRWLYRRCRRYDSNPKTQVLKMPNPATNLDHSLVEKITARYEKLTGKKPTTEIRRLPNGESTHTPAEQLRHSREVKVSNESKLSGSAQFTLELKPDKTSVSYANGDDALKPLARKLEAAHYPLEFPRTAGPFWSCGWM